MPGLARPPSPYGPEPPSLGAAQEARGGAQGEASVRDELPGSWGKRRRAAYEAGGLEKGANTRCVVTNRPEAPRGLYDRYVERGETENRIKDYNNALRAERLSRHRFRANRFRLLLHAATYWLLGVLREWPVARGSERMQLDTLRLRVVKIGGRVRRLPTKVRLHLASGHPGQRLWRALAARGPEEAREQSGLDGAPVRWLLVIYVSWREARRG